ncbi:MAG: arylesterase [Gammaproteobacteria bacterium]
MAPFGEARIVFSISRRLVTVVLLLGALAPLPAFARTLLVVGDSLSAAYGIDAATGWVAQLQQRLREQQADYTVINASISGDTSANGRARLPRALAQHRPALVVIELGGNDGLRGLPLPQMKRNLADMVRAAKRAGARVLLIGIKLPPNYGQRYTSDFERVYQDLAKEQRVALVPHLLDGVAGVDGLMQPDGIHPTAAAQTRMLDNVWPALRPLL